MKADSNFLDTRLLVSVGQGDRDVEKEKEEEEEEEEKKKDAVGYPDPTFFLSGQRIGDVRSKELFRCLRLRLIGKSRSVASGQERKRRREKILDSFSPSSVSSCPKQKIIFFPPLPS